MERVIAVDFETEEILGRPHYPPKPVGVAIDDGKKREYLSWGHPSGNNCTRSVATRRLKEIYRDRSNAVVFHHASFDLEVGEVHLGLPWPINYHCTMIMAFLHDPRSESLELKLLAEEVLGDPPKEQTRLKNWILKHIAGSKESDWGRFIALAPAEVVSPYAKGDVRKTRRLYLYYVKQFKGEMTSLQGAYRREIDVLPVLNGMERVGIRTSTRRLKRDVPKWEERIEKYGSYVIRKLGGKRHVQQFARGKKPFNIGSGVQLAEP